jgi:hypothetical protein
VKVSVIGDSWVSSMTSVLPVAVDELPLDELPPAELELLQAAAAMLRMAPTARLFITACFIA